MNYEYVYNCVDKFKDQFINTKEERKNPKIINGSRRKRIANGSGSNIQDVNRLIKQFEDMSKLMKNISSGKRSRFMQNLKMPMGFGG